MNGSILIKGWEFIPLIICALLSIYLIITLTMTDISDWNYYYNWEVNQYVRANLVYTALVSPDKKTFCMDFNRQVGYHCFADENALWTEELLTHRFENELKFHTLASNYLPTLKIENVDTVNRRIFLEWTGDDFLMQRMENANILPNWEDQWMTLLTTMWDNNIAKISIHPNSWTVKDGRLIPINWFFCYPLDGEPIKISSFMIQVSTQRREKMAIALAKLGFDLDTPYTIKEIQTVALNSFRANYSAELIDRALNVLQQY